MQNNVNTIILFVKKGFGYIPRMGVCVHTHTHTIWIYRMDIEYGE